MPEQSNRDFWLYVGLVISGLLNLTGMASIVDGLVTWAHFFREIIDVYRTVIREPLAYVGNHIWPFGHIPHWVFDVFVLWSALFLAKNIYKYADHGETMLSINPRSSYRDEDSIAAFVHAIGVTIFLPITANCVLLLGAAHQQNVGKGRLSQMGLKISCKTSCLF